MRIVFNFALLTIAAIVLLPVGCAGRVARGLLAIPSHAIVSSELVGSSTSNESEVFEISAHQFHEPLTLSDPERAPWLIAPAEAVQIAVENSKILQDLGGSVLRSVSGISSIHEPAIQATDPRLGIEAALSAFDAQFTSGAFLSKNDFPINNRFLGGGTNIVKQDLITFRNELTKATAYGSELFARTNTLYDSNSQPSNLFRSSWQANIEAGFRHHLGRGGGLDYNRIAGPGAPPGTYSGVLIARVSADSSVIDFEMGLRDLVNDVENAYWDLYFAYRNLEAKIAARDAALNTWRVERLLREQQSSSGDKEARAREQYYRLESQVLEALTGREIEGTRTNNGSSGGTFRAVEGVHVTERRLRLLMNLPINDHRMLRPSHDPILVNVLFSWPEISRESLLLRPELRKQDLQIKRSQLELVASKNALKPQVDLLSQYRIRGLGHDLWGFDTAPFDNAVANLTSGQFQEWQFGAELSLPVGFRRAYNNVRNAHLKLARDHDILSQKQRRIIHDLSNAYASAIRSFEIANVTMNQRLAAHEQLAILKNLEENKSRVNTNEMLDAQARAAQADAAFYDALVRYMVALKNVHYEKGTILEYNNITFADRVRPRRSLPVASFVPEYPANALPTSSALQVQESIEPPPNLPAFDSLEAINPPSSAPPSPVLTPP